MEPFTVFVANEEPGPFEQEALDTLNKIVGPGYEEIVNLSVYRSLHGAILRNAQALNPVSPLHLLLNSLPPEEQFRLVNAVDPTIPSPAHFVESTFMQQLCIEGSGMFPLANSTNHSCSPNIIAVSSTNDNKVTIYALKNIRAGEELCISYIDETMPFAQRQAKLQLMYHFVCECPKCHAKS